MAREHFDLLISGTTAFLPEPLHGAFIGVAAGQICYIGDQRPDCVAGQEVAADGLFLLPGLVDSHVHFRSPGLEHKEDYLHGSRAAIAGGVTTVLDMPNTNPATYTVSLLMEKARIVSGLSYVDYGFHFMLTKDNYDQILQLRQGDVASVKVFMAGHETAPHVVYDIPYLTRVAKALAERNVMMTVHAEYQPVFPQATVHSLEDYSLYKVREAAIEAVKILIEIARETQCRVHVVHTSTVEEVDALIEAKNQGVPITFELIHPHLNFTQEDFHASGWNLKLSPPLRKEHDRMRLWEILLAGDVDTIGSDHAPHTVQEKQSDRPPAGMPAVQETLSAVWTGLVQHGIENERAASILAEFIARRPAQLFGLPHKGQIAVGRDADLVLVDPKDSWQVQPDRLWSKCGWSPYQGRRLQGVVKQVYLRGDLVYAQGQFLGEPAGNRLTDRRKGEKVV